VPVQDGARVELTLPHGRLSAFAQEPFPQPGQAVRVRVDGAVRYERDAGG